MELQARVYYRQRRLEEARFEVLRATDVYEKLGNKQPNCLVFLR